MKAYKVFNNDWTCNNYQFEVGKIFETKEEIKICKTGFHACLDLKDCFNYYPLVQWSKFAEVEILGEYEKGNDDSKIVTNKIHILHNFNF